MTSSALRAARALALAALSLSAPMLLAGCQTPRSPNDATATDQTALQQAQAVPSLSITDAYFIDRATRGGLAEAQAGILAEHSAGTAPVRRFAARMVADHTRLNQELQAIAMRKRISLPTTPSDVQERALSGLQGLSGAVFDRQYLDQQVLMHVQAISLYREEAQAGSDPDVKEFAARALPELQQHLQMAEQLGGRASS